MGPIKGAHHLSRAARLILHPQLRLFVIVPLLMNLVMFVIITSVLIQQFDAAVNWMLGYLPSWLSFLSWIIWLFFGLTIMLVYGYSFSIITNILAAPFYGVLAERAEWLITGKKPASESLLKMIPRTLGRELQKLGYFLLRLVGILVVCLLLSFIPLVNLIVPLIWLVWGAWSLAIQYVDYPADNHQLAFKELRRRLGQNRTTTLSFGGLIMLGTMIPVVNIFLMPIAVIGGTYFWTEQLTILSKPEVNK